MSRAAMVFREVSATPYGDTNRRTEITPGDGDSSAHVISADPDVIENLGDEIATLSARIHAATHRLLELIADFDRLRGWELAGYSNCARWLAARTGIDLGAAREKVRAARALEELPLTRAATARGELSFSQVRALSRVARAENEGELLELARGSTTAQLERMVRAWKKGSRADESERERELHDSRTLSVFPDDEGMYVVRARLMPEVGALLMRATLAADDALFRERRVPGAAHDNERHAAQRRADAVALLAERALALGFQGECAEVPISATRAERYQVMLHVERETLSAADETGRSELLDGTGVSAETSRRLSCDASIFRVTHGKDGSILDIGRKTRTISPGLRRALEVRDRGCRFPGCGLRITDAHHVIHWADGGPTSLSNCLLLCSWHHRLVHEGGWRVEWWGNARPVFYDPRGGTHFDGSWKPPALPTRPVAALIEQHERLGIEPDAWTASARWKRHSRCCKGSKAKPCASARAQRRSRVSRHALARRSR